MTDEIKIEAIQKVMLKQKKTKNEKEKNGLLEQQLSTFLTESPFNPIN